MRIERGLSKTMFKATPRKARLTALHEISLHIYAILHKNPLTDDSLPAEFLYNPTKNLTAQLSHKLCVVQPIVNPTHSSR